MPRGGKRPNAGRKQVKAEQPTHVNKSVATELIAALIRPASDKDSDEVKSWRPLWECSDARIRLDTRKFLYEKRDGKAVHTVNHLHDKPIEHTHTHTISERMRIAMEKAELRVSGTIKLKSK